MGMQQSITQASYDNYENRYSRISWSAIFLGVIAAIMIHNLFNMLGIALGFAGYEPEAHTLKGIGVAEMIWLVVTNFIAMFIGGWLAGRLSGFTDDFEGYIHGFAVWGLSMLVLFMLLATSVGSVVSGTAGIAKNTFTGVGKSIAVVTPAIVGAGKGVLSGDSKIGNHINRQIETWLNEGMEREEKEGMSSGELKMKFDENKEEIMNALELVFSANSDQERTEAKDKLIALISNDTGISKQDIQQKIEESINQLQQEKEELISKTQEKSKQAAATLSRIALMLFFILLVSLLAASYAGKRGANSLAKV